MNLGRLRFCLYLPGKKKYAANTWAAVALGTFKDIVACRRLLHDAQSHPCSKAFGTVRCVC